MRILAYLNVSFAGIFAFSRTVMVGESSNLLLLDLHECVRVARENADLIVGSAVRVGRGAGGSLRHRAAGPGAGGRRGAGPAADGAHRSSAAHAPGSAGTPAPGRRAHALLPQLPHLLLRGDGGVREEALRARERGVLFDISHGAGSFGFRWPRLLAAGFPPDAISSDVHVLNVDGPATTC
ncbi:MAG: hypothetical protein IPI73_02450 [Betaproteobacteria bacterium]|nr:hypothetical protein [Betaproteobacteria bacterium]